MAKRRNPKTRVMAEDAPWRGLPSSEEDSLQLFPKVTNAPPSWNKNGVFSQQENGDFILSRYALTSVVKRRDPIGEGWASEANLEAAGPDCLVPGLVRPLRLLGLQVWPITVDFKFMKPVGHQLRVLSKFMDSWVNLMNRSLQER